MSYPNLCNLPTSLIHALRAKLQYSYVYNAYVRYSSYSDRDRVFRLASPVISASFQCDTCTTSNLSTPVQVTFKHTEYDQV
jgi:hypothetical protein